MVGIPNNRRTQYTRQVIREAFASLLEQKEFSKITITEIAEKADINRGTFYHYYKDTNDLLAQLELEMVNEVVVNIRQELPLEEWLEELLQILQENQSISHLVLIKDSQLLSLLLEKIKPETFKRFEKYFKDLTPEALELCLEYFVCGSIGLIAKWLKDFPEMPPKRVAGLLIKIFATNVYE